MSQNIYIAKIHIPIIQQENGQLDSIADHIHIYYEQVNSLPPKSETTFTYSAIKEQLVTFLENKKEEELKRQQEEELRKKQEEENAIKIRLEDISNKPKKHNKNSTFKNRPRSITKYTMRSYASDSD